METYHRGGNVIVTQYNSIRRISGSSLKRVTGYHDMFIVVRFQVLTEASKKMTAFWYIAPRSLVEVDWHFRSAYCIHHDDRPDGGGSTDLWNVDLLLLDQ
jgi:hypothetical protein